jgi:hypothetical protein
MAPPIKDLRDSFIFCFPAQSFCKGVTVRAPLGGVNALQISVALSAGATVETQTCPKL